MKITKRETLFLLCIVIFVICICTGIVIMIGKTAHKQTKEKPVVEKTIPVKETVKEAKKEEKRTLEFENFNLLESDFMVHQIEDLKVQITYFIARDSKYDSLTKVICKEAPISTEKKVEFYCLLGAENTSVLRATYNKEKKIFRFWIEEITPNQIAGEWEEKQQNHIDTSEWDTEEELPSEWTYVEEDKTTVSLVKKELLENKIPKEKLENLESEILNFLKENDEYRREMEVQKNPKDGEDTVEFDIVFTTPRLDKKDLHIVYDKKAKSYQFALQGE